MTSGKEDYLKAIYLLSENHDIVTNKELSQTLQVSPPSVSEMITKLQKQGYVDYTAYKGSKMTRKGRKEAGRLLRYHALWEVFLVNYLHFSWSQAHEMAEGLEHQTEVQALFAHLVLPLGGGVGGVPHGLAVHLDDTGVRPLQKVQAAQQGGLAGAGRTDDGQRLALFQGQRDIL